MQTKNRRKLAEDLRFDTYLLDKQAGRQIKSVFLMRGEAVLEPPLVPRVGTQAE